MQLQNARSIVIDLEPTAEVLASIRDRVQRACDHAQVRPVATVPSNYECMNCGRHLEPRRLTADTHR